MKIAGAHVVPYPPERVWSAILDPQVLVATIPGCSRLETTGEHAYAMTVTAGVAAIKGTYDGTCALSDLAEPRSLVMRLRGEGAPGSIDATVQVRLDDRGDDGTRIDYDADAIVGGMIGGVGQRMLTSVSKRMATEFFGNVTEAMAGHRDIGPAAADGAGPSDDTAAAPSGAVFTSASPADARSAPGSGADFARGVAVGAGLVLLGVLAGRWAAR